MTEIVHCRTNFERTRSYRTNTRTELFGIRLGFLGFFESEKLRGSSVKNRTCTTSQKKIWTDMFLAQYRIALKTRAAPNERTPKTFALKNIPERIPNELVKNSRMPEQTTFISGNLHEFSFPPRHQNFLVNVTKPFLLKIFVFHRSCTDANQMTSHTENSFSTTK